MMTNEDCISRDEAIRIAEQGQIQGYEWQFKKLCTLPSVTPSYNSVKTELKPSEDCISRTALLARIDAERNHLLDIKMDGAEHIIVHHARRIIEDMPTVKPQQKVGKWINQYQIYGDIAIDMKVCSECRYEFSYDAETGISNTNYCPNCGARMFEPQESEDKE